MDLPLSASEKKLVRLIQSQTYEHNMDNISRTEAYFQFFQMHPEIKWSFLAHMVSRNAGWNMGDLEGKWFPKVMTEEKRALLFRTYERANWLIFQDAYPQLLLYHYSTKKRTPMFHLLRFFHVSQFMEEEWNLFWEGRDKDRLATALIINEQNVIHNPVIKHPLYRKRIFHSFLFSFQEWLHYSCVLFPTVQGELYGASVHGFTSVDKRIDLGKRLFTLLFAENLFAGFYEFAQETEHTGSRFDYEQYFHPFHIRTTPKLRTAFPIIHHHIHHFEDWSKKRKIKGTWRQKKGEVEQHTPLTAWYKQKQRRLHRGIWIKTLWTGKKG